MYMIIQFKYLLFMYTLRRRYSFSPPTTAGNSTTTSVSEDVASRDECDDQTAKSPSKLDDDGTFL